MPQGRIVSEFARSYNSISGSDIKVYLVPKGEGVNYVGNNLVPSVVPRPDIMAVSYRRNLTGEMHPSTQGSLVVINYNGQNILDELRDKDMVFIASQEWGGQSKLIISDVKIVAIGGGVSVDDTILEEQYEFVGELVPWQETAPPATKDTL